MSSEGSRARIGPNAITQIMAALDRSVGARRTRAVFAAAGLAGHVDSPPKTMVDERDVAALHAAVRSALPEPLARQIALAAGRATGDYLLQQRIPGFARAALRAMPAGLASRVLLAAIARHAWTFAGSGRFHGLAGDPTVITLSDCPLCRGDRAREPLCGYYAAIFERLYESLVHPRARVVERECIAAGANACLFEIRWRREPYRVRGAPLKPR